MSHFLRPRRFALLCCLAACSLAGCGGSGVKVTGKVVPPAGAELAKDDMLQVTLIPSDPKLTGGSGNVDATSLQFRISGPEKGVPPGSYKVAVTWTPYAGHADNAARKKKMDPLFASFAPDKTPLTVEVSGGGSQQITVDLDKKTVSK